MGLCWRVFQDDMPDLNKRLLSIECQLKKSELSRKHLEVTNKKLLVFAQVWILMSQYISALNMETQVYFNVVFRLLLIFRNMTPKVKN